MILASNSQACANVCHCVDLYFEIILNSLLIMLCCLMFRSILNRLGQNQQRTPSVPNFPSASNGIHGIKSQVCSNHAANAWIDILNFLDYGADHVLLLEFQGFKRIGLNSATKIKLTSRNGTRMMQWNPQIISEY